MNKNLTDIVVVMDRSGSMDSCRADAEGGLNAFVAKQRELPGQAVFTLVQFDDVIEVVHRAIPIAEVPTLVLEPRGATALCDAVGRTINETGIRLAAMPEADRPGLVAFVIVTDGGENASHEFTRAQVRQMTKHQESIYSWQFTYLGANQDAFAVGSSLGIKRSSTANYNVANTLAMFENTSAKLGRIREQTTAGGIVLDAYTEDERNAMVQ